jgi:hypothetical protein|tara:strand:- start:72 stop:278 length:207 start_codon:yes stop_codon:yes gene_type:complete
MRDITIKLTQQEIWLLDRILQDARREFLGEYAKFQQYRDEYQPNAEAAFLRNIEQVNILREKINLDTK